MKSIIGHFHIIYCSLSKVYRTSSPLAFICCECVNQTDRLYFSFYLVILLKIIYSAQVPYCYTYDSNQTTVGSTNSPQQWLDLYLTCDNEIKGVYQEQNGKVQKRSLIIDNKRYKEWTQVSKTQVLQGVAVAIQCRNLEGIGGLLAKAGNDSSPSHTVCTCRCNY